jgi:methyl-accepting chemotaxis protein
MPMTETLLNRIPAYRALREQNDMLKAEMARRDEALRSIEKVCREAAAGNLEPRILGLGRDGALADVARSVNHLLDLTDAYVRESTVSLSAAVDGRFYRRFLERGMLGSFRGGARAINTASDQMKSKTDALEDVSRILQSMGAGDFTGHLEGSHSGAYGRLQDNLNDMTASLRSVLAQIRSASAAVASSSDDLGTTSLSLSSAAEQTSVQIQSVSAASVQAGYNVQTVAAATEEMSTSIREINRQLQEAARVGSDAAHATTEIVRVMDDLGRSSIEIDSVINVITDFARQTNLLALNAMIEASRAGEAGKGFLVVAHEVGQLATQTAAATENIASKVRGVQKLVEDATAGIRKTAEVVSRLGEINAWVATSMGEQTAVTSDIAQNVTEAALGTDEAAKGVTAVAEAADETARGAARSLEASEKLREIATSLEHLLTQFRT